MGFQVALPQGIGCGIANQRLHSLLTWPLVLLVQHSVAQRCEVHEGCLDHILLCLPLLRDSQGQGLRGNEERLLERCAENPVVQLDAVPATPTFFLVHRHMAVEPLFCYKRCGIIVMILRHPRTDCLSSLLALLSLRPFYSFCIGGVGTLFYLIGNDRQQKKRTPLSCYQPHPSPEGEVTAI